MLTPNHQITAVAGALVLGVLLGSGLPDADNGAPSLASRKAVPAATAQAVAPVQRNAGAVGIERPSPVARTVNEIEVSEQVFSSNGDPAFDAPDPFGAEAHGMDMVDGARLATGPVPVSGEPLGSIPLL
jgi:hypothetical protein